MIPIREATFGLDDHGEAELLSPADSLGQVLYNLFITVPGSNPSEPTRGIDIKKYLYRPKGSIDESDLRDKVFLNCFPLFEYLEPDDIKIIEQDVRGQTMLIITLQAQIDVKRHNLMMAFGKKADRRDIYYKFVDAVDNQIN